MSLAKLLRKWLLLSIVFIPSLSTFAAIYQMQEANGSMSYSDSPSPGAVSIDLSDVNTVNNPSQDALVNDGQSPPLAIAADNKTNSTSATNVSANYTQFTITSPSNNQTFQNQREITLQLAVSPELKKEDQIQTYVDGKLYNSNNQTTVVIQNLDRGTHSIQAKLVDANGKVLLTTQEITIYLHYATIQNTVITPAIPINRPADNITTPAIPLNPPK